MSRITRQSIDEVRNRADIVALIGDYTALKKAGASWRGLSPFAAEKTPSFYVHPNKGFFYCFSTAQGGDIYRFVMLKEGLGFQDAVERVAKRFNITLQYEDNGTGPTREERSLRAQLFALHDTAATLYTRALDAPDATAVRDYWTQQRRFDLDTARRFQIGYAPPDGASLARALMKAGFGKEALAKSGLFTGTDYSPDPYRWHPKFHGRLMIPIRDIQGRTVAFTARLLPFIPPDPRDPAREAKYVNSPETDIFHKSQILFNLDKARAAATRDDIPIVLVEGQLDAIRAHTCGATTAVASQGTAIGPEHLALIRRYTRRLDALLDADRAGRDAVLRLLPHALRAGVETRVLSIPDGKDPDEYLAATGPDGWPRIAATATTAITFTVRALLPPGAPRTTAQKLEALQTLFEIIGESPSAIVRHDALEEISRLTAINPIALQREHATYELRARNRRLTRETENNAANANAGVTNGADAAAGAAGIGATNAANAINAAAAAAPRRLGNTNEETLLAILLNHPDLAHPIARILDPVWVDTAAPAGTLLNRATAEILESQWDGPETALQLAETDEETSLLARLIVTADNHNTAAATTAAESAANTPANGSASAANAPSSAASSPANGRPAHAPDNPANTNPANGSSSANANGSSPASTAASASSASPLKRGKSPRETANESLAHLFKNHAARRLDELTAALATLPPDDHPTLRRLQRERSALRERLRHPPALPALP